MCRGIGGSFSIGGHNRGGSMDREVACVVSGGNWWRQDRCSLSRDDSGGLGFTYSSGATSAIWTASSTQALSAREEIHSALSHRDAGYRRKTFTGRAFKPG